MKRYAMLVAYDGSQYYGWQIQVQTPTVQYCIEKALGEIAKEKVHITCAGRTDSGVHALGQVAHFDFDVNMTPIQMMFALKTKLPKSIQVLDIVEVPPQFHARYDAQDRTYQYIITFEPTAFNVRYKTHFYKYNICIEKFRECIQYFLGEHDFTSFAKPNPEINNHICNIKDFQIESHENDMVITITANRFLHNMVRRMVGALVAISHKSLPPSIITEWILAKKHEQKNYITAPPNGLYLSKINYETIFFNTLQKKT